MVISIIDKLTSVTANVVSVEKKISGSNRKLKQKNTYATVIKSREPQHTIASRLLNITTMLTPIAFLCVFFLPNYFSISAMNKMIFSPADGNCVSGTSGFGNHCFGDYGATINLIRGFTNPWFEGSALGHYPPLNLILLRFFSDLELIFSHSWILPLYLITIIGSGLFPIWSASRKYEMHQRQGFILFLGLLALPLLAAVDRGNPAVWAIPTLYLAVTHILDGKTNRAVIFLSISIALRPQLIIFLLLFLMSKKYVASIKTLALTSAIYILSFVTYLASFDFKTLIVYLQATRNYGSGIPGIWPPNLSLARGIKVFLEWFSVKSTDSITILISVSLIFCALICIYFSTGTSRIRNGIFLLIPIVFLSAPMTWYYYGSFLLIVIALMIKERLQVSELFEQKNLTYTYLGGLIITNSVLFFPVLSDYNNLVQYLVPVYWATFYISFFVQSITIFVRAGLRLNAAP
jgi:hypothetical protein